jgi:hypothetical protein
MRAGGAGKARNAGKNSIIAASRGLSRDAAIGQSDLAAKGNAQSR